MNTPSGYTALDFVGFTDKGAYSSSATYVRNDLVHADNKIWKCKIDDTTGVAPTEGANWTIFMDSQTALSGMTDVSMSSLTDGDDLEYEASSQKWKNKNTLKALKTNYEALGFSVVSGKLNVTYTT